MGQTESPTPKSPTSHLHAMNLVVALLAGVISITGGIYSLKNNLFSGPAYGSLQGIVRDGKIARPLKLAVVEVADLTGAVVNTAETDDNGHYLIEALKTGNYAVKFTAPLHKVETKTIKIEKDLASSISVDLVPEFSKENFTPVEAATVVPKNIPASYTPVTAYQAPATAASSQPGPTTASSYNTVPASFPAGTTSPAYPSDERLQDPSANPRYPGSPHHHPRRYPGDYDQTSSSNSGSSGSQGNNYVAAGTQLLQALMTKKSEDNATTADASSL